MNWPQITIAVLMVLGVGFSMAKDGEPKTGKHSFWVSLIAAGIEAWVLYAGGFWK